MSENIHFRSLKTKEEKTNYLKRYILNKYPESDASNVEYKGYKNKINISCKTHGMFEISVMHLIYRNQFCKECSKVNRGKLKTFNESEKRINIFNKLYKNIYELPYNIHEIKSKDIIQLECKKHGVFKKQLFSLLKGSHCQKCTLENCYKNNGCGEKVFKRGYDAKKSMLYIIELEGNNESFIKIGITNDFNKRFKSNMPYKINYLLNFYNGEDIYFIEKTIKKFINSYHKHIKYKPLIKFGGYTECYKKKEFIHLLKDCLDNLVLTCIENGWDNFDEFKD